MKKKSEIISFKADPALLAAMKGISNRSEFIRNAILSALDNACPFCKGTGILTPQQDKHWQDFLKTHTLEECNKCSELYIACSLRPTQKKGKRPDMEVC